jgi:hypothetical protein
VGRRGVLVQSFHLSAPSSLHLPPISSHRKLTCALHPSHSLPPSPLYLSICLSIYLSIYIYISYIIYPTHLLLTLRAHVSCAPPPSPQDRPVGHRGIAAAHVRHRRRPRCACSIAPFLREHCHCCARAQAHTLACTGA